MKQIKRILHTLVDKIITPVVAVSTLVLGMAWLVGAMFAFIVPWTIGTTEEPTIRGWIIITVLYYVPALIWTIHRIKYKSVDK